jgi:hypothetical protein
MVGLSDPGRTRAPQGVVHLVIFGAVAFFALVP